MKCAVGSIAQQWWYFRRGICDIVVDVTEFVIGGFKPFGIGLDTHQAADIFVEVEMPG